MKRLLLITALLSVGIAPAYADTYVIVDNNNTVVSGAIVCDAGTCGDRNSLYSQLTLQEGQRYVLQNKTDSSGNDVGVGVQPNQIIKVKEEVDQNSFVVIRPEGVSGFTVSKITAPIVNEEIITEPTADVTTQTNTDVAVETLPDWLARWLIFWEEFLAWLM